MNNYVFVNYSQEDIKRLTDSIDCIVFDEKTTSMERAIEILRADDIVEETQPEDMQVVRAINPGIECSQRIGEYGEDYICDMINSINNKYETIKVSSTGHMADIHIHDHKHKISYITEVKLKKTIIKEDVDKFYKDVKLYKSKTTNGYKIIGLFLSIDSQNIPSIGDIYIDNQHVFLTQKYITPETLNMLFKYFVSFMKIKENKQYEEVKYTFSQSIINTIIDLRKEYEKCSKDETMLKSMISSTSVNLNSMRTLLDENNTRHRFLAIINELITSDITNTEDVDIEAIDNSEKELREYIRKNKSKIKKGVILEMFPQLQTQLGNMKLSDIVKKYS